MPIYHLWEGWGLDFEERFTEGAAGDMLTTFAMVVSLWQAADVLLCICVLLSIILVCGMMNCDLWRWTACV